jgi:TonB-dependent starch-binding outer membrane protein SusC
MSNLLPKNSPPSKSYPREWQLRKHNFFFLLFALMFFCFSSPVLSQQITITGKISDGTGGLPGVTVLLKGTTNGTTTDLNGNYSLSTPGTGTLIVSYVGYQTQEVAINNRTTVNVKLLTDAKALEEVVVIGYGTLDKKEVTSSISHVSAEELSTVAANDPLMRLQGKVSGLTVQNTGAADPNSTANIQLRGVASRTAGTSPLIVIDGVPGGNLQTINENDIASIDILKDGAASAIYGTRGSNGVILITTKKGSEGAKITYDGYASFDVPSMTLDVLSADEFRARNRGTDFGASTDWLKEITRDYAFTQKNTLALSGGNGKTNYRGTVDYQNSTGLDIRSDREQYGARLSVNHSASNGLYDIILNVAPRYVKSNVSNRDAFTQALNLNPTLPIMDPTKPQLYYFAGGWEEFNPVENLRLVQSGSEGKYLDWNGTFKLNLLPRLNTQVQLAQVSRDNFGFTFSPSTLTTQIRDNQKGTATRSYDKFDQYSFEWLANYSLDIKKHSFTLLGVYSYQYFVNSFLNADNRDFSSDVLGYNNLGNGTYNMVAGRNGFSTGKEDNRLISFRTRINYSFADKYLLTASLTRDGSSRFGANNKWGYFPGISAGWRVSGEPFMQGLSWISDLKFRADYGETGNQDFSNYQSLPRYQGFGQYMYNGSYMQVWGPANNLNPDLRWEKLKNWNVGLDFSLFNDRLNGALNYYSRRAVDLLGNYNAPLPPNIVTTTFANVGTMRSNGIELELGAAILQKEKFQYEVSFNGSTNNTVFVSFSNDLYKGQRFIDQVNMPAPGSPGNTQRLQEGERIGMFFFWKHAGVDENGNFLVYNKNGVAIPMAEAKQDDKQFVGNGQPKFTAGMNHVFRYNNWDASASLRGNFGYDIFNVHEFYYGLQSASANTNVLAAAFGRNAAIKGDKLLTDYFLEKGDFVKLDVVTLGYTFKAKSKYFDAVRLYGSTRNLYTFTKFQGVDPDIYPVNGINPGIFLNGTSGSKQYYPSTTQLLIGAQFNF